ncbi:MAG: hypothetical protein RLY14_1123 [Planctomycetota bacterium]|jgi:hypothetical protein
MNKPSSEPPPLPSHQKDGSYLHGEDGREWLQERGNQILVLAIIPLSILLALMTLAIVWNFPKPQGLGAMGTSSTVGDSVTALGNSGGNETDQARKEHEQDGGEEKEVSATVGGGTDNLTGMEESKESSSSESKGQDSEKVEESVIVLPSGKVSSDAMAIALGDPFNPFLESASGKEVVFVIDVSGSMSGVVSVKLRTLIFQSLALVIFKI